MKQFDSRCHSRVKSGGQQNSTIFSSEISSAQKKLKKSGTLFLRVTDTSVMMLRILSRYRHAVPLPPQLPANPPPARPPVAGPKAPNPFIFNIPRPRVTARMEAIKNYLPDNIFFVAQCLVDYLPSRAFHHRDIDRALMTLKNDLTESHRHFQTGQPLAVTFSNTRKDRKQVDVLLDVVLRALFDVEIVLRVYRVTMGSFDSHLKKTAANRTYPMVLLLALFFKTLLQHSFFHNVEKFLIKGKSLFFGQ